MTYEKPEVHDFGSIAEHTYEEPTDCFPGQSPCVADVDG
jgi:hypothetical protein